VRAGARRGKKIPGEIDSSVQPARGGLRVGGAPRRTFKRQPEYRSGQSQIRRHRRFVDSQEMKPDRRDRELPVAVWLAVMLSIPATAVAQTNGMLVGLVVDETGGALPGVTVEARAGGAAPLVDTTSSEGRFQISRVPSGRYQVTFRLVNFAPLTRHDLNVPAGGQAAVDVTMRLALNATVTVTGKRTFKNLADAEHPEESLVGLAVAASQGAVTAAQIDSRPMMRAGEVLETVPGVIISQHSGEGKANQYYLRGFNLDHGTDFATTVAGMPVNMPSHAHGQGYSDVNFLIPELISGVQFEKGPYYAQQGDFSAAGAAAISYANALDRTIVRVGGGQEGADRFLVASSPRVGGGNLLVAFEGNHNDGPWVRPDRYRRLNGVIRYSQGNAQNGLSITGMGYDGRWNSTDQVPERAIASGLVPRFGAIDPTDGGATHRYSGSFEWQRTRGDAATNVTAYAIGYKLDLFSDFTYFLGDPVNGDQFEQFDSRVVSGASATQRRLGHWFGRDVSHTYGIQLRNDDIGTVGLYHTKARQRLSTTRQDAVMQTSAASFYENEFQWADKLRTQLGLRFDTYRFRVNSNVPENSGIDRPSLASPKAGVAVGPWGGTEFYANAGYGFHSNDARGATITLDPLTHAPVDRVTPLVRAKGAEVGVRTVAVPHVQSTVAVWMLNLESELVFAGDAGTTETGRPSHRAGVEWASYFSPAGWLTVDADVGFSSARFVDVNPVGDRIPGAAGTIISIGAAVPDAHKMFGGLRWRYFGPRPLIADNSVRSPSTGLLNGTIGFRIRKDVRLAVDTFNLANSEASDIDYYYASRLPGEPRDGISDVHTHPIAGRTARVSLLFGF